MRRILLVGQDVTQGLSLSLFRHFRSQAQMKVSQDLKASLDLASHWGPKLILLDGAFGEASWIEAVQYLRRSCVNQAGIIACFGTSFTSGQRRSGYEVGVADFLETDTQTEEEIFAHLHARLRALNWEEGTSETIAMGNLTILPETLQVKIGEEQVKLTQMEIELLRYFVEHPNRIIPRGKLLGDLWPDAIVTDRTVDTHVANLRKKIRGFCFELGTVYGAGYILKT